ncbi:MAG: hypothetical protein FWD58_04930 [Firmicutes bacterium]|nr:hypothetical protein [Bacillota bacterium]
MPSRKFRTGNRQPRVAGDGDPYGIVCVHPESRTPNPESRIIGVPCLRLCRGRVYGDTSA